MKRWLLLALALSACTQPKPDADPLAPITVVPPPDASPAPDDGGPLPLPPSPEPEPEPPAPPEGPSCALSPVCGPSSGGVAASCCEMAWVPGGVLQFGFSPEELKDVAPIDQSLADRDQNIGVSGFFLDRFEITVGRFLTYARQYDGAPLPVGSGAHPLIEGSGWQASWNNELPRTIDALLQGTSCRAPSDPLPLLDQLSPISEGDAGASLADRLFRIDLETLATLDQAMACLTWFQAQAFCIWDRGRLPTEAEWELAAAGGAENRAYPWGDDPSLLAGLDLAGPVGSHPDTRARYGHDDMAGGVREWTFDGFGEQYRAPGGAGHECSDCANLEDDGIWRVVRGGGDDSCCTGFAADYRSAARQVAASGMPSRTLGARCARDATDLPSAADASAASPTASSAAIPPGPLPAN